VVVLTAAALESKWVKTETDTAIAQQHKGRIQVIPLDVEPCEVPPLLSSYQMVSFRHDYDAGLSQLADILGVRVTLPFEPEMVLIPAGEFLMGSEPDMDKEALPDERPQHTLYLPDYYMARTPVTNAQYAAFVESTGHSQPQHWKDGKPPSGKEDHPVVYVFWYDVVAYCDWLAEVTGKPYRLPSEAEWEKGARGTDGRIYPWGDLLEAWRCNIGGEGTSPVGVYPTGASPYGLLDMAGNVWEWTHSVDKGYPYDPDDGREDLEAKGPRVLRGGSWFDPSERYTRCAFRLYLHPSFFYDNVGLRVVVSARSLP
jgi:formylglycine-generating enzyme required for sulfatase activity